MENRGGRSLFRFDFNLSPLQVENLVRRQREGEGVVKARTGSRINLISNYIKSQKIVGEGELNSRDDGRARVSIQS